MNLDQVYAQFALFAGLPQEEREKWAALCEAAIARVRGMLLPDALDSDPRLTLAAAGEVYYQYRLLQNSHGVQNIKVGDISVSGGVCDTVKEALALRDELFSGAAGLLNCGFAGLRQVV